jgi:hypothetical protein
VNRSNHWIELDFNGITSNRDGIGSIVTVTAGSKQQRKERNGGNHRWSKNNQRLHSGLRPTRWRTLRSGGLAVRSPPIPTSVPITSTGVRGWQHHAVASRQPALSPCGPGHLQQGNGPRVIHLEELRHRHLAGPVTAGGGAWVVYKGDVQSDQAFTSVTGFSIESNDTLNVSDPSKIVYSLGVGNTSDDGFDFKFPAGAAVCFNRTAPTNLPVFLGSSRTLISVPLNLETLGACN